tara:strand:+ start:1308 stop:1820 length:513 start_codon:yes stop_codon:yes gene_type:complete
MADKSFGVNELNVISNSASAAGIVSCTNSMTVNAAQVGVTTNVSVTGVTTSGSFHSNDTTGDGTDVGFAIKYNITADGISNYRFAGPGVINTSNDPTLYLQRGFTYVFNNATGGHPFRIQFTGTTIGVGTYVSGSQTGVQVFTIPHDAPANYEYECTSHANMKGSFIIPS